MTTERTSRSFALEQTYVNDVYEQFYDNPRSKPWPKVQEFLEKLEPGALVCDVGCGNGKYLKVNKSIYNIGGEKSNRLSDLARQKQNEIIRLDNLALPYRDNCFDTVLSLSVVHHFATTDRRVSALREMARVLRVGGRMIITVWAMEQEHRKFESQDVLVPWRRPRPTESCSINTQEDIVDSYTQTDDGDTGRSFRFRNTFKRKSHRKHRPLASSGSSSLSSPSETCYGFVRRALQKIAGGGRRVVASTWFIDNWIACMHKQQPLTKRYDPDGCEYCECSNCDTVEDQPIELLRIDDEEPRKMPRRQTCPVEQMRDDVEQFKSRSMNNIIKSVQDSDNTQPVVEPPKEPPRLNRPKLVKQKKSINEEDAEEALDQPTDMKDLVKAMPDFRSRHERGSVLKQRSLNEEILSTDRLREKERLKQHIQKQTSLNEDLIYKRTHTFESIKDSFFAVANSKSFQMLKNGLTNRIKSTTMEKVAGASLKNGFVKIFQTWKGAELKSPTSVDATEKTERRHSKEDGSDSSKDSSLQSDTSVDSEDSFASVIFVPKSHPMSPIGGSLSAGPASPLLKTSCQSAPQSPRLKQSSCPTSPRIKQLPSGIHPLTKQLSSPRPSTELLTTFFPAVDDKFLKPRLLPQPRKSTPKQLAEKYSVPPIPQFKRTILNTPNFVSEDTPASTDKSPEDSRAEKLKTIKDILEKKPGFGKKTKSNCPIVRKINDPDKKEQSLAKSIPKLLKLEIFNPEEDDDSDNSCVSSPDSTDSIASIRNSANVSIRVQTDGKFQFPDVKPVNSKQKKVEVFSLLQQRFSDTTPLLDDDDEMKDGSGSRRSSNTWNEECHKHLTAFADKLSEKLMKELDEYQLTMDNIDDPYIHRLSEELHDLSILSEEIKKQNEYLTRLSNKKTSACIKTNRTYHVPSLVNDITIPALNSVKITSKCNGGRKDFTLNGDQIRRAPMAKGSSSDSYDSSDKGSSSNSLLSSGATSINFGGQSIASSVTDLTGSNGGSTASLVSMESRKRETLSPGNLKRRDASGLSDVSADSWPSDEVGGEIIYHRFYHVFREGELEKLIDKYVDDLHVVSSTYDHASWCIIAEKVQIWTI